MTASVGAVAAGVAVWLWLKEPEQASKLVPVVTQDGATLALAWRF